MRVEKDYKRFLNLLNKHNVKYCIIGAFAVAFYAKPGYTKDLDILVEPSEDNAHRIIKCFKSSVLGSSPYPLRIL
jgi:membrane-bound acyltransferase YfiQ involved in biofilm formation